MYRDRHSFPLDNKYKIPHTSSSCLKKFDNESKYYKDLKETLFKERPVNKKSSFGHKRYKGYKINEKNPY